MSHDEHLFSALAGRAARLDSRSAQPRYCEIADVDAANHLLRVIIRPGSALSAWMPYGALSVGAIKISIPPAAGEQAHVTFPHGDAQEGIVVGLLYSSKSETSGPAKSPFTNAPAQNGELLITGLNGFAFHVGQDGKLRVKGDLIVDGDVYDKHGSLDRLRGNYNAHRDVDSHGDTAGLNDHQDPE
jgi:hypothetical protein